MNNRQAKLKQLAELKGTSISSLLEDAIFDGSCPSICMNAACDYTTEVEPDQDAGYCEICDANTVVSCLI